MLKSKVLEIVKELNHIDSKASDSWFRSGIELKALSEESSGALETACEDWKARLSTLVEGYEDYEPKDFFNTDESGAFYQALPVKSFKMVIAMASRYQSYARPSSWMSVWKEKNILSLPSKKVDSLAVLTTSSMRT